MSTSTTPIKILNSLPGSNDFSVNSELTWILSDHLGSTTGVVNSDGDLISILKYTAYGEIRAGSSTTDYRYTGQREESEIELYYYVARFYDPDVGRFISPDSLIPNPTSTLGFDRFSYVNENPINRNDPSGHWLETAWDIANLCYDVYEVQKDPSALNITLLVIDAVAIIIPVMPGIGSIIHGGKVAKVGIEAANRADDLVDVVKVFDSASDVGSPAFKSFTRNNFRENLRTLTGAGVDQIIGKEAHHILPQQFEKQFRKAGIENIHDPKFGSWIDKSFHQQISKEYNNLWESFLKNDPTKEEIFGFAEDLANTYGFDINF